MSNKSSIFTILTTAVVSAGLGVGGTGYFQGWFADKPAGNEPPGPIKPPINSESEPRQQILDAITKKLQEQCERGDLGGVWIAPQQVTATGSPLDGKLVLEGFIEEENQRPLVVTQWEALAQTVTGASSQYPNGLDATKLIPLSLKQAIRKLRNLEAGVRATGTAWRGTWINNLVYSADRGLVITGTTFANDQTTIVEKLKTLVEERLKGHEAIRPTNVSIEIKSIENPAITIQNRILQMADLQGVTLDNAGYNGEGKLLCSGVARHANQEETLRQFITTTFLPEWKSSGILIDENGWALEQLVVFDPVKAKTEIQKQFATGTGTNTQLGRVQVKDIKVQRTETEGLQFVCLGYYFPHRTSDQLEKMAATEREQISKAIETGISDAKLKSIPMQSDTTGSRLRYAIGLDDSFQIKPNPILPLREKAAQEPLLKSAKLFDVVITDSGFVELVMLGSKAQIQQAEGLLKQILQVEYPGVQLRESGSNVSSLPGDDNQAENYLIAVQPPVTERTTDSAIILAYLQKSLAAKEAYRNYRLDDFNPDDAGEKIIYHGVWMQKAAGDKPDEAINDYLKGRTLVIMAESQANYFNKLGVKPEFLPVTSPLEDLRGSTISKPELQGAVFDRAYFDGQGKLQILGYIAESTQLVHVDEVMKSQLANRNGLLRPKDGLLRTEGGYDLAGLVDLSKSDLGSLSLQAIQEKTQVDFASGGEPFNSTQVRKIGFRYTDAKGDLKVIVEGAHFEQPSNLPAAQIQKQIADRVQDLLKQHLPPIKDSAAEREMMYRPQFTMDATSLKQVKNPVAALQKAMQSNRELDGVLLEAAQIDREGKPRLKSRGEKGKQEALVAFLKVRTREAIAPIQGDFILDSMPNPFRRAGKELEWNTLLQEMQKSFAAADSEALAQAQTRIDRLYFGHNAEGRVELHVSGVCLREQASVEADSKLIQAAVFKWITSNQVDFGLTDATSIQTQQIVRCGEEVKKLVSDFKQAFPRKTKLFYFRYDANGKLAPFGLGFNDDVTKEQVQKFFDEKLKDSTLLKAAEYPTALWQTADQGGSSINLDGFVLINAKRILETLQADYAREASDPVLRQTRLDAFDLDDSPDTSIVLAVKSVTIRITNKDDLLPQLKTRLSSDFARLLDLENLSRRATGDPKAIKLTVNVPTESQQDNPIPALQAAIGRNSKLDGALFEGIRYDAERNLVIAARVDASTNQKQILDESFLTGAELFRKISSLLRIPPAGSPSPAMAPIIAYQPTGLSWAKFLTSTQEFLADSDKPEFNTTRVDRAYYKYQDNNPTALQIHVAGITLHPVDWTKTNTEFPNQIKALLSREKLGVDFQLTQRTSPVFALQQFANEQLLDDVLFYKAYFDREGRLHLKLYATSSKVPYDEASKLVQSDASKQALQPILAGADTVRATPVVDSCDLFRWLIPDSNTHTLRDKFQAQFALSDSVIAKKTRLDRVYFQYRSDNHTLSLGLDGVCLVGEGKSDAILTDLKVVCQNILSEPAHGITGKLKALNNPVLGFQQKIPPETAYDGMLFHDVRVAGNGQLLLDVLLVDTPVQKKFLADLLNNPPVDALLFQGQSESRRQIESNAVFFDWPAMIQHIRTRWAAREAPQEQRQTWLQRAYFTRPTTEIQLNFQTITLARLPEWTHDTLPMVKDKLSQMLDRECQTRFQGIAFSLKGKSVAQVEITNRPMVLAAQTQVALTPTLDGVRLDEATFQADGTVQFEGIWRNKLQEPPLRELLTLTFREQGAAFARQPFRVDDLQPLPTDTLLREVRRWVVTNTQWEELLVSRLYFDAAGQFKLQTTCTDPLENHPKIREDLKKAILAQPLGQTLYKPAESSPTKSNPAAIEISHLASQEMSREAIEIQSKQGITSRLREQISNQPEMDGVRLDRSYFDEDNRFVANGLLADNAQHDRLIQMIETTRQLPAFQTAVPNGFRIGEFFISPVRPLLLALPQVLPADPIFDGLVVNRIHHGAKGELIIRGRRIGKPLSTAAQTQLVQLLQLDPNGKLHLGSMPPVFEFPLLQVGLLSADAAFEKAVCAYSVDRSISRAIHFLDEALLHCPTDASAWYFRGYCYLVQGNDLLAERDLRRLAEYSAGLGTPAPGLEEVFSAVRLERVQGMHRARTSNLVTILMLERPQQQPTDRLYNLFRKFTAQTPPPRRLGN